MPIRRRIASQSLISAVALVVATAGLAQAAPPPAGGLTPVAAPLGCVTPGPSLGCQVFQPMVNGRDVATRGDTVYVAAGQGVHAYRRLPGQGLQLLGCVTKTGVSGCFADAALESMDRLALSPDGSHLYAAGGFSAASSRIAVFPILPGGTIGARSDCITEQAFAGCTDVSGIDAPTGLALSPDGGTLYVAAEGAAGALAAFDLDPDGTFAAVPRVGTCFKPQGGTAIGCVENDLIEANDVAVRGSTLYAVWRGSGGNDSGIESYLLTGSGQLPAAQSACVRDTGGTAEALCPTEVPGLQFPTRILAPADGSVTVGANQGLSVFAGGAGGAIGARTSCRLTSAASGCEVLATLGSNYDLDLSPDGSTLYAAMRDKGVVSLQRNPADGALGAQPSPALGGAPADPQFCGTVLAPVGCVYGVAVSDDGLGVFTAAQGPGSALSAFTRQVAPVCSAASAQTTAPTGVSFPVACSDANGDPLTYEVLSATGGSAIAAASGVVTFTPAAGFAGTATVGLRATDGTNVSSTVTATIAVAAAAPPAPPVPGGAPGAGATAATELDSDIAAVARAARAATLKRFSGTASGRGLARVQVSLVRLESGARAAATRRPACRRLTANGTLGRAVAAATACRPGAWLTAKGTASWSFALRRPLPPGRYVLYSRAVGTGTERTFSTADRNRRTFTVR